MLLALWAVATVPRGGSCPPIPALHPSCDEHTHAHATSPAILLPRAQVIVQPLIVPSATQPLARCNQFEKLWASHEHAAQGPPYARAGAGGVDVLGSDKGVTLWRPQPPMGYAVCGDVLTAGASAPTVAQVGSA